jgi:hypothetical protein
VKRDFGSILTRNFGLSKLTATPKLTANLFEIPKPLTGFLYSNNQMSPPFQAGTVFLQRGEGRREKGMV